MRGLTAAFGGASIAVIGWALAAGSCAAQSTTAAAGPAAGPAVAAPGNASLGEVVVTARRRNESIQDVPQSVVPVTAAQLQQLQIKNVTEIAQIVPGLNINFSDPSSYQLSLRGIPFDVYSNGQPNVAFYLNDAPVSAGIILQPQFDVGQIEVLRGPQGTTRGVSAPSGAITLTTQQPNMSAYGGYIDGEVATHDGRNVQGAVNIPILPGILAARVSGAYDETDAGGVHSIHSDVDPSVKSYQARVSLRFTPTKDFEANVVYEHVNQKSIFFDAVTGPGNGTAINPPIAADSRQSVEDGPSYIGQIDEIGTWNASYRFLGQRLTYVGSYQYQGTPGLTANDIGNFLPGLQPYDDGQRGKDQATTQEIRLSSDKPQFGFIDYTIGAYYTHYKGKGDVILPTEYLPGAFGVGSTPDLSMVNNRYLLNVDANLPNSRRETSFFGNLTFHLPFDTELSGGIRRETYIYNNTTQITEGNAFIAEPAAAFGLPNCAVANFPSTYPGFCDFPVPGGGTVVDDAEIHTHEHPVLYNVQLSHHLTRDILIYGLTGTAYRPPTNTIGIDGAVSTDPNLSGLNFHPSEHSTDYEAGFKSTFLDHRALLNVTGFYQTFHNFTTILPDTQYLDTLTNVNTFFTQEASVDAKVDGVDIESAFKITPEWNISAQFEYAKLAFNGQLPVNLYNAAGQPVYNTDGIISLSSGGRARLPLYNTVIETDYTHPVSNDVDGFVRALATIYPSNPDVEPNYKTPSYALLNAFAGIRSHDGAWVVTVFAKNLLDNRTVLDINQQAIAPTLTSLFPTLSQPSGYSQVTSITPQRQVGIDLHYSWGSR